MGGNAFGRPAQRLSTPEFQLFLSFAKSRLGPVFPAGPIETVKYPLDKVDHGDLDLLVAWEGVGADGSLKGSERGLINEGSDAVGKADMGMGVRGLTELVQRVGRAVGAIEWVRGGQCVSFMLPVQAVFPDKLDVAPNASYQLDLLLIHPAYLPFHHFFVTTMVLGQLVRALSRSLTLTQSGLFLRHTPFPGMGAVEVVLTRDPARFCQWAGLDYTRWSDGDFASDKAVWQWLANVEKGGGGAFERSLGKLGREVAAGEGQGREKKSAERVGKRTGGFGEWLRGEESGWHTPAPRSEIISGPDIPNLDASPPVATPAPALLDPDHPVELSPPAQAALDWFGKLAEYESGMEEKRKVAREMFEAQMRNQASRDRARLARLEGTQFTET